MVWDNWISKSKGWCCGCVSNESQLYVKWERQSRHSLSHHSRKYVLKQLKRRNLYVIVELLRLRKLWLRMETYIWRSASCQVHFFMILAFNSLQKNSVHCWPTYEILLVNSWQTSFLLILNEQPSSVTQGYPVDIYWTVMLSGMGLFSSELKVTASARKIGWARARGAKKWEVSDRSRH